MRQISSHFLAGLLLVLVAAVSCRTGAAGESSPSAIWAASDRDKVAREELRASKETSVFSKGTIRLFGAKNEVVAFNLVVEAAHTKLSGVTVKFDRLNGPGKFEIRKSDTGDPFNYVGRDIELFYVRYLPILGLSKSAYETYDERHIPRRFRRKWNTLGYATGQFDSRPHGGYHYPDIAVPLEVVEKFDISAGTNQSIWVDIYIPKSAPAGRYRGRIQVNAGNAGVTEVPVELLVHNFSLPDQPTLNTMVYLSGANLNKRYLGRDHSSNEEDLKRARLVRDRHFQLAHRHRISLIGDFSDDQWPHQQPRPEWEPRLSGELFTPRHGYSGPGIGYPNNIYGIGIYGSWTFSKTNKGDFLRDLSAWGNWFATTFPKAEVFLYLIDESDDYATIERWSSWMDAAPPPANNIASMATCSLSKARQLSPSLDWPCNVGVAISEPSLFESLVDSYRRKPEKRLCFYNGRRPFVGSFAIEDDGTALQALAYAQYKKQIDRWFYWESTYYNNYQGGGGQTNLFQTAQTFGAAARTDAVLGQTSWMYGNGDGVLFYPGTDKVFPAESYELEGPIASLRLKYWRRGIQDGDYLALAAQRNSRKTQKIVNQMVPKVLWEYGVSDPGDPTWVRTDISWSSEPDKWEDARANLAEIILTGN